jgi:DNA-binding LytR/AlgR family response regulator
MICLTIDDDPLVGQTIEHFAGQIDAIDYCLHATDGFEALNLISAQSFDCVFLDLHLPEIDGVSILRSLPPGLPVVVVSSSTDFGAESYDYNVVDYLVKPLEFARFRTAVDRVAARARSPEGGARPAAAAARRSLFVKSGSDIVSVRLDEVKFLKADANYVTFELAGGRRVMALASLKKVEGSLPGGFLRVHRSYIVNREHIERIEGATLHLRSGDQLPVGESYRAALLSHLDVLS